MDTENFSQKTPLICRLFMRYRNRRKKIVRMMLVMTRMLLGGLVEGQCGGEGSDDAGHANALAMEKMSMSVFLLLVAISHALAKDITPKPGAKKEEAQPKFPQTLSRGWGDKLFWTQTYEEALYKAKTSNKPLMIIHHLEECPHSQALKKVFAENNEIQKLADKFVLLNLIYETTDKHLSPMASMSLESCLWVSPGPCLHSSRVGIPAGIFSPGISTTKMVGHGMAKEKEDTSLPNSSSLPYSH
uniref:Anterior gradient 2, protein disulphide isomerase family member n=1 Tax=Monodelphis domestica TaxID=13616 RepID=F7EM58_MONDO